MPDDAVVGSRGDCGIKFIAGMASNPADASVDCLIKFLLEDICMVVRWLDIVYARIGVTTFPCTSVRRNLRP